MKDPVTLSHRDSWIYLQDTGSIIILLPTDIIAIFVYVNALYNVHTMAKLFAGGLFRAFSY